MMYQISENMQVENLDAIILSVSGGGMAAGVSIAAKSINKDIKIILVEPVGKKLLDCLNTKERKWKGLGFDGNGKRQERTTCARICGGSH